MDNLNKINNKEIDIYSKINEPNVHFLCKGYNVLKEKFFIYYEDFFYIRGIKKFFILKILMNIGHLLIVFMISWGICIIEHFTMDMIFLMR